MTRSTVRLPSLTQILLATLLLAALGMSVLPVVADARTRAIAEKVCSNPKPHDVAMPPGQADSSHATLRLDLALHPKLQREVLISSVAFRLQRGRHFDGSADASRDLRLAADTNHDAGIAAAV